MSAKKSFSIAAILSVILIISSICDWIVLIIILPILILIFFSIGVMKYNIENTYLEYNEFSDMSKFYIGMPKEDVKKLNSKYIETRIDETNEALSNICETCGGKVVNGVCTYCGNKYDDNTKISYLIYNTKYGERRFVFKGHNLTNIKIQLNPIEKFL